MVRAYGLTFTRMGEPDSTARESTIDRFDSVYPSGHPKLDQELCELMVYLQAPSAARKGIALLLDSPTQSEQLGYAKSLRHLKAGWTMDLREDYFRWFSLASAYRGNNYQRFLQEIKDDAVAQLNPEEAEQLHAIIHAETKMSSPTAINAAFSEIGDRTYYRAWTVDELAEKAEEALKEPRDLKRGRAMFGAVSCFACHQFDGEGEGVGPDLTGVTGRFGVRDLLEAIIEPSSQISDQYGSLIITQKDGTVIHGRIVEHRDDRIEVNTNLFEPAVRTLVNRNNIESIEPAPVSMMPPNLINILKEDEIMDLLAYLLSGGK